MAMTLLKAIDTLGENATVEAIGPLVNIPAKALAQEVLSYSTRGLVVQDEKTQKLSITLMGRSLMDRGLA